MYSASFSPGRTPLSFAQTLTPHPRPPITHQFLFHALRYRSLSPLQKPLPFARNPLSPRPPLRASLSRQGFYSSLASPFLNCTNFLRVLFSARHPCKLPFPLCVPILGPTAPPGPHDFLRPPDPLDHLLVSSRPRSVDGIGEGRHHGAHSCCKATRGPA